MFAKVLNTLLKLDIRQQIKSLFKANDISDEVAPKCPVRKVFLIIFAKFIRKYMCRSLFLIKLQASNLKGTFLVDFFKLLKKTFIYKTNVADSEAATEVFCKERFS